MTVEHTVVQWTVLYYIEEYLLCVSMGEDAVIWQTDIITVILTAAFYGNEKLRLCFRCI